MPLRPARLAVEKGAQAGVAGAAYWQLCAVCEHSDVAILTVGLDFGHSFQVDDVGSVDA